MPTFPLTDSPVQISQSITQDAQLQNIGDTIVYLSNESAVSPASFGLRLNPGSTVTWPANRELWAVVAPGLSGNVAVLYNASGTAVSEVTAAISGTVDVRTTQPVLIQGGGEGLWPLDGGTILPGETITRYIPEPASGLAYPSIRIFVGNSSGPGPVPQILRVGVYVTGGQSIVSTLAVPDNSAQTYSLGDTRGHTFTIPFAGTYPIQLFFANVSGPTSNYEFQVWGSSAVVSEPTTDLSRALTDTYLQTMRLAIPVSTTLAQHVYLPASFQKWTLSAYAGVNASMTTTGLNYFKLDGTLASAVDQPHISRSWLATNASGALVNRSAVEMPIPSLGLATRFDIMAAASNAGTIYLSYFG
jgi:hypothetical protein